MALLRSFYVADGIWRFAWSLVGCLLAISWLPPHTHPTQRLECTHFTPQEVFNACNPLHYGEP